MQATNNRILKICWKRLPPKKKQKKGFVNDDQKRKKRKEVKKVQEEKVKPKVVSKSVRRILYIEEQQEGEVEFLPENTTSLYQMADQGVIAATKVQAKYKAFNAMFDFLNVKSLELDDGSPLFETPSKPVVDPGVGQRGSGSKNLWQCKFRGANCRKTS